MKTPASPFPCAMRRLVLALVLGYGAGAHAQALPLNATVINGTVGINNFSNGMQVINSPGAIIHWDGFSIGAGRTVRFDQQTATSAVLNRVTGNTPSQIFGTLQSNGRVFLINPNGILFGAGARVDVAGLLASTLDISDDDFLAGNYRFRCTNSIACEAGVDALNPLTNRVVLQDGSEITTRTAGDGGQIWLMARDRVTSDKGSKVEAPGGQVIAAAAREVTVTSAALGQMSFTLTGTAGSRIDLAGDIDVPRGAAGFFADQVRLAGGVRARSDIGAAGQITANASSTLVVDGDARLSVSGNVGADAGAIRLGATQKVTVAASVDIAADGGSFATGQSGGKGGLIELRAADVQLPGLLAERRQSPVQLHARGSDSSGVSLAQYGRIDVLEGGNFEYGVVAGPSFATGTVSTLSSRTGLGFGAATQSASNQEAFINAALPGIDGSYGCDSN